MARIWAMFDTDPVVQQLKSQFPHEEIVNNMCWSLVQADSAMVNVSNN